MSGVPPEYEAGVQRHEESDYLWDGSGPVDPDVERFERMLAGYRHKSGAAAPRIAKEPTPSESASPPVVSRIGTRTGLRWAAAAMVTMALGAAWLAWRPAPAWTVRVVEGGAQAGERSLSKEGRLRVGEWLRTDPGSRAQLEVAGLGQVEVAPGSRIRIKESGATRKLLDLSRGEIHAMIYAEARVFLVDTPSARAVDLGCEYTLKVAPDGSGELRVELGYVALEGAGFTSTVPMDGGMCLTRPGFGPGTPFFDDATPRFRAELQRLDFGAGGRAALDAVLDEARVRDALSLWHLLSRTKGEDRAAVYERLVVMKPLPEGVTREGVLALDAQMLQKWWDWMRPFWG